MVQRKIEELFYEYPLEQFQIRGISRKLNIPKTTVKRYIDLLIEKGIVKKEKDIFPYFKAREGEKLYTYYKKQFILEKIIKSGLIEDIEKLCNPSSIILFGSMAKGEFDKNSDIDIFVESEQSLIVLKKYERFLKYKINLLFQPKIQDLGDRLINNIVNGTKLSGFLRVKWKK